MPTKKPEPPLTTFVSVIPLEKPGIYEFKCWGKVKLLGVWMKPWNQRDRIPHLVFQDCPTSPDQVVKRILFLEGQAQLPIDESEKWVESGVQVFPTQRSFGTIWSSANTIMKTKEPKRGRGETNFIELAGVNRGAEYDAFDVSGFTELGGTLDVTLMSPFLPSVGDEFDLVEPKLRAVETCTGNR